MGTKHRLDIGQETELLSLTDNYGDLIQTIQSDIDKLNALRSLYPISSSLDQNVSHFEDALMACKLEEKKYRFHVSVNRKMRSLHGDPLYSTDTDELETQFEGTSISRRDFTRHGIPRTPLLPSRLPTMGGVLPNYTAL